MSTTNSSFTPQTFDVDALVARAKKAQEEFAKLEQEEVDKIFFAVAHESDKHRVPLAVQTVGK